MTETKPAPARNLTIDVIKGLFVLDMIWSHVTGYTDSRQSLLADALWNIFIVVTFSGFIFCMGYIMQTSYLAQEKPPVSKMLRSTWRSMLGYYIAALGFFLIYQGEFDWETVTSVLLLQRFGSISEFLLPFALIPLVTVLLTAPLKKYVLSSNRNLFIAIFLLAMTTFLPTGWVQSPYLALLIGGPQDSIFYPVLQYYAFFLLGAYYASRKIQVGTGHLLVSIFSLAVFVASYSLGLTFSRFPPSFGWIVLGGGGFFLWYWVSERLARWRPAAQILAPIGANSLFFFVVSDLLIFGVGKTFKGEVSLLGATALTFLLTAVVYAMMVFVRPTKV
jgi:surface polysaccharide O-acyltransferase-like enzyme